MNPPSIVRKFNSAVLICTCFLLTSLSLHAQDQSAVDTIAYMIKNQKKPMQLCDDLYKLGNYYREIGNYGNAKLVANKCKELAEKYNYEKGIYEAYALLGNVNVSESDYVKALSISKEWLQLATQNHNEQGSNRANFLFVSILYRQGNLDSAVSVSKRILEAPHVTYDSVTFPKFNSLLGAVCLSHGDFHNANTYYLDALNIAEKTHDESMQSICLGNLAMLNEELGNTREALKYQNKGLALLLKNNQLLNVALMYENMGITYESLANHDSAIYLYNKALPIFKQLGSDENIAIINDNIGYVFMRMDQLDTSMHYLQLAKQAFILLNSKDAPRIGTNLLNIGKVWMMMSDTKKNKTYLRNGLTEMLASKAIAEQEKIANLKMESYYYLSLLYDQLGIESQAFDYLKKYNNLSDSIRGLALTSQIAEMQTKYETEKKESEITKLNDEKLLDAEKIARQKTFNYSLLAIAGLIMISGFLIFRNVQKKRAAEKQVAILEKQNAIESMRSKIASDVHDEMGANLTRLGLNAQQLLSSAVIPEMEKQLAEKMSLQSKEIITGMREIIWASNPANDNLKSMLGFMRQYIDRFFDGTNIRPVVNFPHDIGEISLHPEVRRNLFLILKESLNNAVKYSGSNKIDIDFSNENENFNLNIKDYGKGMDTKTKDDFSHGLHNMQMRAEQIKSLFKLTTAPGMGVQIAIEGKLY